MDKIASNPSDDKRYIIEPECSLCVFDVSAFEMKSKNLAVTLKFSDFDSSKFKAK